MKEFKYEKVQHIGTVTDTDNMTLEVNIIRFNGKEPKVDIRRWDRRNGERMLKGIAITKEEAVILREVLQHI